MLCYASSSNYFNTCMFYLFSFEKKPIYQANAIVNTTSHSLDLKRGQVSNAILKAAGPDLQKECRDKYPEGIKRMEIAETSGHKLKCKYVFHLCLEPFVEERAAECIQVRCV